MDRRKLGGVVAVATLALTLAACGQNGDSGTGGGGGGGNLDDIVVAMTAEPGSLNFLKTGDSAPEPFYYNVYEGLTKMSTEGKVEPLLATDWETKGKKWVAQMRPDVTWQNGDPFTAADAAASINKVIETGDTSAAGMVHAEATGDMELTVETANENPEMPQLIARIPIEPASLLEGDELDRTMVGTGPYKFVEWNAGSDIVLARNDDYWGDKANFAKVTWFFRDDSATRMSMLQSGEANIAYSVGAEDAANIGNDLTLSQGPASVEIFMRPTFTPGKPLADPRLRQAIDLAIDRKALVDGVYHGLADDPHGQIVIPAVMGFNPDIDSRYDPDAAKALIKEAGAEGMTLTLSSGPPEDKVQELTQAVQQMLEDVGFKIDVSYVDNDTWRAQNFLFGGGDFSKADEMPDLVMSLTSNITYTAYSNLFSLMCTGSLPGGCDQKYTDLVNESQTKTSLEEREALYQEAFKVMQDDGLAFPLIATQRLSVSHADDHLDIGTAPGHKLLLNMVTVEK